jgi:type I restriction enzyme S subunit
VVSRARIAAMCGDADALEAALRAVLADAIERRVGKPAAKAAKLPQAILKKAFSGELVPTEAELARAEGRSYETAEELLARVRGAGEGKPAAKRRR